jgi:NAD(P) transhydrogenase subunit beta
MQVTYINLIYLIASALFIFSLKGLTHPRTAVRGNLLGAVGMLLAIVVTLLDRHILDFWAIFAGLVVGSAAGAILAVKIRMTAMPQFVALLNGFGGGTSVLVAGVALTEVGPTPVAPYTQTVVATVASGIIGAVTFWGSLVAFAKLQELISERAFYFTGQQIFNGLLALATLGVGIWIVVAPMTPGLYWVLVVVSSILGILLVIPIGGADMPVIISFLNSFSGLAAAATGFVLVNYILIIAGSLVGSSGIILTLIMCKAMNRSLTNVLFVGIDPTQGSGAKADDVYAGRIKSTAPEEVVMLLEVARRVVIVPGYGMAVSQAQQTVRDLVSLLEKRGTEVEFAIHPVAGRMPGHMNVLLAEADIPYDKFKDMDVINPTFAQTDVVLVIGANDVVNPLARTDPTSPIAGMPILDVDKARTVIVIKRSLSPGFAGIPNPLFAADNTLMLFGDGKGALLELLAALKSGE